MSNNGPLLRGLHASIVVGGIHENAPNWACWRELEGK
jgi:hypothetical protein